MSSVQHELRFQASSLHPVLASGDTGVSNERTTPEFDQDQTLDLEAKRRRRTSALRHLVHNSSPVWFSVSMGTGIVGILLSAIPWQAVWLYWLSVIFLVTNTLLFTTILLLLALQYTLSPRKWLIMINDPAESLSLGGVPIALATLIEAWIFLCVPYWGTWAAILAWIMWIIDATIAVGITLSHSYILVSRPNLQDLGRITAVQILPIAATVVAAGVAAETAGNLVNADWAIGTLITGFVLWALSVPLAMVVLVIYYQRLIVHKVPPTQLVVTSLVPLGPLGMGGFTIMSLGRVAKEVLPNVIPLEHIVVAGDMVYLLGILVALVMWGFGLFWLFLAVVAILEAVPLSFNMSWWSFTFPCAVFALSTMTIGVELPSMFFKVLGTMFTIIVVLLWGLVSLKTAQGLFSGRLSKAKS